MIDSHAHFCLVLEHGGEIKSSLEALRLAIDIGSTHSDLPERYNCLKDYPHILLAGGMGPWETGEKDNPKSINQITSELNILKDYIIKYNVKFIGETGLDNHYEYGTVELQEYLFREQLELSYKLSKPVLIHNREADDSIIYDLLNIKHYHTGIIHCYSGNLKLMNTAISEGFYISYAGNITYKSNSYLRDTLKYVPIDRLLVETDSPYLPPVPLRGTVNIPLNVKYVYKCISEVLNIHEEKLIEQVHSNFMNFCNM